MHGSNLPLRYWFIAIHLLTATKKTISAKEMQRQLGHKRYQPIWEISKKQTVPGKEAPKVLPWVHIAISNAKALFQDFFHGMKDAFLQLYLNEFCYKFNRMYFGDKIFDRLMIASVTYKPDFEHKIYNKKMRLC